MTDTPLSEARKMLSWRHLHMRSSRAGVLGMVLDAYAARQDMPFADWVAEVYDPEAVAAGRGARR
jgi:hypothetical protein